MGMYTYIMYVEVVWQMCDQPRASQGPKFADVFIFQVRLFQPILHDMSFPAKTSWQSSWRYKEST